MGRRFIGRGQVPRMDHIKSIFPTYGKSMLVFLGVGASIILVSLWGATDSKPSDGRRLLGNTKICNGDTLLPVVEYENTLDVGLRAFMYLLALGYLFLGVAISADTFMASIEVITSKTTKAVVNGEEVDVDVWNSTVANLTLMALGSSAPEILLAVVETVSLKFEAGALGPGTIVGSAAFNLLFITAICISCLPETEEDPDTLESRMIDEFGVYCITAVASLWAYLWMVVTLDWVGKDVISLWEAIVTFLMFPVLVWVSWAQDQGWWGWFGAEKITPDGDVLSIHTTEGDAHREDCKRRGSDDGKVRRLTHAEAASEAMDGLKSADKAAIALDPEAAAKKAAHEAFKKKKKSRLQYRIQATRKITGGKKVIPGSPKKVKEEVPDLESGRETPVPSVELGFECIAYQFDESCGSAEVKVVRTGLTDFACTVLFDTSDGDAKSGDDYVSASGHLNFEKGEVEKPIRITIIDDNEWAPDKNFFVRLFAARILDEAEAQTTQITLSSTATTTVTILNDDDPGSITFESKTFPAMDTKALVEIPLLRKDGCDGNVLAFVKTTDGTAKVGIDFKSIQGPEGEDHEVHFEHKVREAMLPIELIANPNNANTTFSLEITGVEPEGAKVGEVSMCTVIITNDKHYQKLMEDVVAMMDTELNKYSVGTSSWQEQFHSAMNMAVEEGEEPEASAYILHFLSFYWKVIHAVIPPTDYGGGWYTFWVSLVFIGGITCLVGDTAKMLGCCIGLDDSITAITFVALGTSLPDTFASVEATTSDESADAAITNVTGSNSVNVFLGLGLPWLMAAAYHEAQGTTYNYKAGDLVFSVLVFFAFAFVCIGLLFARRQFLGGELGGNKVAAYCSSGVLGCSWVFYVVLSSLKTEKHI